MKALSRRTQRKHHRAVIAAADRAYSTASRPPTRRTKFTDATPPVPWRSTTPVIKACLEDLRQAQSHLQAAVSRLLGVATSIEAFRPDIANSIIIDAGGAQTLARSLDADVTVLRDLADPKRGVR